MELTKEQKEYLVKEEERLKTLWKEPVYQKYKLKKARRNKPDVVISEENNLCDFLAIGFTALAKQITNPNDDVIYFAKKRFPTYDEVKFYDLVNPSEFGGHSLAKTALEDVLEEIEEVVKAYHKEDNPGILMNAIAFPVVLVSVEMGYNNNPELSISFKNFDDTVDAQRKAFEALKKFIVSSQLGAIGALMI